MVDGNGKLFGKLSLVDLFIVLVIAAALIWLFGFRNANEVQAETATEETFVIKYMTAAAPDFTAGYFKVGDTVEDFQKNHGMGIITDINLGDGYMYWADEEGNYVKNLIDDQLSMEISTEVRGLSSENGVIINGTSYLVAQDMTLRVGNGKIFIKIVGIDAKEGGQ